MSRRLGSVVAQARRALVAAPFGPPGREATLLMARTLGLSEAQVMARSEEEISPEAAADFHRLLSRRLAGEPVAYLVGEKEFYGRSFAVDRRVLIPRPETEHLVAAALEQELPPRPRILDVGTGSGCVAVTLALESPRARVLATDVSPPALAVAASNVGRHGVGHRVRLACVDLLQGLDLRRFDLVVSNPPYVDPDEAPALSTEVRDYEPAVALFSDQKGTAVTRRLLGQAGGMAPGVALLFEIGYNQSDAVRSLVASSPFQLVELRRDYGGVLRTVVLRRLAESTRARTVAESL